MDYLSHVEMPEGVDVLGDEDIFTAPLHPSSFTLFVNADTDAKMGEFLDSVHNKFLGTYDAGMKDGDMLAAAIEARSMIRLAINLRAMVEKPSMCTLRNLFTQPCIRVCASKDNSQVSLSFSKGIRSLSFAQKLIDECPEVIEDISYFPVGNRQSHHLTSGTILDEGARGISVEVAIHTGSFDNTEDGRVRMVESLLGKLISSQIQDTSNTTPDGKTKVTKCKSVLSSLWMCLLDRLADDHVICCPACGKCTIVRNGQERGNPREYCNDSCRKKYYRANRFIKLVGNGASEREASKELSISKKSVERVARNAALCGRPGMMADFMALPRKTESIVQGNAINASPARPGVLDKPANASHEQEVKQWQRETEA